MDLKKSEHGCRMISVDVPSFCCLGLEDGPVPTSWLLLLQWEVQVSCKRRPCTVWWQAEKAAQSTADAARRSLRRQCAYSHPEVDRIWGIFEKCCGSFKYHPPNSKVSGSLLKKGNAPGRMGGTRMRGPAGGELGGCGPRWLVACEAGWGAAGGAAGLDG